MGELIAVGVILVAAVLAGLALWLLSRPRRGARARSALVTQRLAEAQAREDAGAPPRLADRRRDEPR